MNASEPVATVSLSEPGDLVAATPALLGFVPRSSLVALALGGASGRRLGLTLRIDLPPPERVGEAAENVVGGMLLDHPAAVVVIVIGPGGDAGPPAVELVERVVAGLAEHGVEACHALWTESTAMGSRWRCYGECGCTGGVPSWRESPLAAATRAEGRVVWADRAELERLVAPVGEEVLRRREALLVAAIDAEADAALAAFADTDADTDVASDTDADADTDVAVAAASAARAGGSRVAAGPAPGDDASAGLAALAAALDAAVGAAQAANGDSAATRGDEWLGDEQVIALAHALQVPVVRDAAVAACAGSRPGAAEALWAALARGTPDPEAAEPAALLALTALLRGDGALANVALARAEAAWPGHHFTATLRGLAAAGVRPGELRACLTGAPRGASRSRTGRVRRRGGAA